MAGAASGIGVAGSSFVSPLSLRSSSLSERFAVSTRLYPLRLSWHLPVPRLPPLRPPTRRQHRRLSQPNRSVDLPARRSCRVCAAFRFDSTTFSLLLIVRQLSNRDRICSPEACRVRKRSHLSRCGWPSFGRVEAYVLEFTEVEGLF